MSIEEAVAADWRPPDYRCEMCSERIPGGIDGWDRHMLAEHGPILRGFLFPPDQWNAVDEAARGTGDGKQSCNGNCDHALATYDAACPYHGAKALIEALDDEGEARRAAAERAETEGE